MKKPTNNSHKSLLHLASIRRFLGIVFIAATLSACGGGGGSAAPNLTPTPTPVDNTPVAVADSYTWLTVNSVVTEDVDAAVAIILAEMTLPEKVGQMVQAEINQVSAAQVRGYNLGSVLNGGGSWPNGKNSSLAEWVNLADR